MMNSFFRLLVSAIPLWGLFSCGTSETLDNDPWEKVNLDSGPEESRVVKNITVTSKIRNETLRYSVWIPAGYDNTQSYPFLYLLHGFGDDNNSWLEKGGAASILERYQSGGGIPMVVIMPDAKTSFYVNVEGEMRDLMDKPGQYENYFFQELMPAAEEKYHCNGNRAIAGLSMGGWGSLFYGIGHPGVFTYCYAMSPATGLSWYPVSLEDLLKSADVASLPGITLESGIQDSTVHIGDVDNCNALLTRYGIIPEYIRRDGNHDWVFWPDCLRSALVKIGNTF